MASSRKEIRPSKPILEFGITSSLVVSDGDIADSLVDIPLGLGDDPTTGGSVVPLETKGWGIRPLPALFPPVVIEPSTTNRRQIPSTTPRSAFSSASDTVETSETVQWSSFQPSISCLARFSARAGKGRLSQAISNGFSPDDEVAEFVFDQRTSLPAISLSLSIVRAWIRSVLLSRHKQYWRDCLHSAAITPLDADIWIYTL